MKTVTVKFTNRYSTGHDSRDYDYLVADDQDVSVGDFAVAHNGSEFAIVKVINVQTLVSERATKTLVHIITESEIEAYNEMNAKVKDQKKLFSRLEQLMAQEFEKNKYRVLAQSNAEAAEIAKQLGLI